MSRDGYAYNKDIQKIAAENSLNLSKEIRIPWRLVEHSHFFFLFAFFRGS